MNNKYSSIPTGEYDDDYSNNHRNGGYKTLRKGIRDQDEKLDVLGNSVLRLGEMSLSISKEIDTQNRMLSSLENEVDESNRKASDLTQKTKEIIKKSGGTRNFCLIVALMLILLFLIFLVIYT